MTGKYLVDMNVISAGSPLRSASPALAGWMDAHSSSLFVSAITFAEIADGVTKLRREGASRRAAIEAWLQTMLHQYGSRVLAFDIAVALVTGPMLDRARGLGLHRASRMRPSRERLSCIAS